ncbi:MAG: DUF72 domain-containing protein [Candidatus Dormibacteria bacterium]
MPQPLRTPRTWTLLGRTPPGFEFVLKLSRYLSHITRLSAPHEPVTRFLDRAVPLGDRRGPLLLQLPPRFAVHPQRLAATLRCVPLGVPIAVELRDSSWFTDEVRGILRDRTAPLVLTDRGDELQEPEWLTARWGYVRLHQGTATPWSCYTDSRLRWWAERIGQLWGADATVYVFFNNDPFGCAVHDAARFATICNDLGLPTTRVPDINAAPLTGSAR